MIIKKCLIKNMQLTPRNVMDISISGKIYKYLKSTLSEWQKSECLFQVNIL